MNMTRTQRNVTIIAWTCCSLLLRSAASAQAPANPADLQFKTEVVVTPERGAVDRQVVPASSVVLEAADLQPLPAVQLSEVVSFLPGFQFQQAMPYSIRP